MRGALPRGRALHGTRLMPDVDVLVVGAGPAGAVAAREAKCAAPELDVALLERDPAPGTPVRCAEGVGDAGLREFADPDGASWVARKITRVILVAPDDTEVKVDGRDIAPGGYAWLFPKGVAVANVGLGLVALKADGRNARQYLDAWIARRYPGGARTGYTVGGVIVHATIQATYTDGALVAGDAAHMINPLSGGGIVNAMKAGRLAGRTAAAALRAGDPSARRLAQYHSAWMDLLGHDHLKYYRLKRALEELDDGFFNALARTVNRISQDQRTLGRIFRHALVRHPQLIPVAARLFL